MCVCGGAWVVVVECSLLQGKAGRLFSAQDLPFSFEGWHTISLFLLSTS